MSACTATHPYHVEGSPQFVPPHRWCVLQEDLDRFEADVRKLFDAYRRNGVPTAARRGPPS